MHPYLRDTIDRFVTHFAADLRCVGLHLKGSGGTETDDEYSDVDLELIVRDEHYAAVSAEMRSLCERVCGPIHLWFPEGIRPDSCNYAFLFEHGGEQFLYDFALATRTSVLNGARRPGRILLDPEGLLEPLRAARHPAAYTPDRLLYTIDHYWIYAYLSGKYARRGDLPKLLYVQQTIFRAHMDVLRALLPAAESAEWGWWPRDMKRLPKDQQAALLLYFPHPDLYAIHSALGEETSRFAQDARAACARWSLTYPEPLQEYVLRHLREMDAIS
jgi:hypothetical protein